MLIDLTIMSTQGMEHRDYRAVVAGVAKLVADVDTHVRELTTVPTS